MIRKMRSLLGLGLALCLMLPLLAQVSPGTAGQEAGEEDSVVYPKVTFIPFPDVIITGTLTMPSSSFYLSKPDAKFSSLVPVRADMLPELVRSADSL
ncbi:MAG TPA: hypothetical protein PK668_22650 [Myxococcota bacterium]|nr:hypothetical protein [Myxococcota bacterium]HRY95494.1 hypothetical protein [Myxococcota bacterium]HSA24015.1 hypothetical protein [Myxococcota bacterium]